MRLRDVKPENVALATARQALDHITSLVMHLVSIDALPRDLPEPEHTEIFRAVRTLAAYAVHGGRLDAPVHEYLISLVPLYGAAVGEGTREVDGMVEAEPETELGTVIAGAVARETLEAGRAIDAAQLALLAGLDRDHVLRLAAAGEIPGASRDESAQKRRGYPWQFRGKRLQAWVIARVERG